MCDDANVGTPIDFWDMLRTQRRSVEVWRYWPARGLPVWGSMGRLTSDPAGGWFVLVFHKRVDSLTRATEAEARTDRHALGVRLMEVCGPGRWVEGEHQ